MYILTSGPGITTPTDSNTTGIFNVTASTSGTYGVSVRFNGQLSSAGTTVFTVKPPPVIGLGPVINPTTCGGANGSIIITGLPVSSSYTLSYEKNGAPITPTTITTSNVGIATVGGLTAGTYSQIKVTTSDGCVSNIIGPVSLSDPNPPVTPTAAYNPPLCLGSTLSLSASSLYSNATYTWSGPNGYGPVQGATATQTGMTYADTGLYFVNITVNGCTSAPGTVRVFVNPPPAAPTAPTFTFCQFSTATPLTATGQNLRWYTDSTGGTALTGAPVPNTSVAGPQTFYVSQTVNTCEGPRRAVNVTITPRPDYPVADTVREVCIYSLPTSLTATGTNILWYTTATGGVGSSTAPQPPTNTTGIFYYYVTQTVSGCQSLRLPIKVIVKPKPAPPVVVSPVRLCQYEAAAPLTAQGQNLLWYTTPDGIGGLSLAPVPFTGYEDTAAYYVSQVVNGCESDRALINVAVNYKPNAAITSEREFVCQFDTISFNYFGNGRASSQYAWSIDGPGNIVSGQGTQGPLIVRYDQPGTYTVSLVVDNNGCLSPLTVRKFEVRAAPRFSIAMPVEGCQDAPITVVSTGATAGIDSFLWDFGGGVATSGSFAGGPYAVNWSTPGTKVVSVRVRTRECGSQVASDTIRIEPTPYASIQLRDYGVVCSGDTVELVADYHPTYTYRWSPDAYFGGSRSNRVAATVAQSGWVTVDVTTPIGCRAVDSVYLNSKSCCDVLLPTAFSPNGDARNDYFRPISQGFQSISTLRVTNRWGRTVWETGDDRTQGWDGTVGGTPADMGTYFWYIKYTCTNGLIYEKSGEVTLLR
jgi:gliding motility-associated-like protein